MTQYRKSGRSRQGTDDKIVRPMSTVCSLTKGTDTHTEYNFYTEARNAVISQEHYLSCYSAGIPPTRDIKKNFVSKPM